MDVDSNKPLVHQIVRLVEENIVFGEIWAGEDSSLTFMPSESEEHIRLKPIEITGAYYMELGIRVIGTKLVHEW